MTNTTVKKVLAMIASLLLAGTLAATHAAAQAANAATIWGQVVTPSGTPAANAVIRVCKLTSVGNPCLTTGIQLYSDPALTQPIADPQSADQYGNYSFYITSGIYLVQITPQTGLTYSYSVSAGSGSGSSGGSVTSVSGATSGGFAVSVANPNSTPVISVAAASGFYMPTTGDQANWNGKVDRSGDTMTGPLNLSGNPTANPQATNKIYVDTGVNSALSAAAAAQTQANLALTVANAAQPRSQYAQPNGYAPLDPTSRVPRANLPAAVAYTDFANAFTQSQTVTGNITATGTVQGLNVFGGPSGQMQFRTAPGGTAVYCITMNAQCSSPNNAVGMIYNNTVPNDLVIAWGATGKLTLESSSTSGSIVGSLTVDAAGNTASSGVFGGGTSTTFTGGGTSPGTLMASAPGCPLNTSCTTLKGKWSAQFSASGSGTTGSVGILTFGYVPLLGLQCMATGFTSNGVVAGIDVAVSGSSNTTYTFNLVNPSANQPSVVLTVAYQCLY